MGCNTWARKESDMTDGLTLLLACMQGDGGRVGQRVAIYLFKSSA